MKKQKDRLVELLTDSETAYAQYLSEACDKAINGDVTVQLMKRIEFYADRLLADGWMRPPCKVGDTVYRISTRPHSKMKYVQETTISRIAIDNEGTWLFCTCNPIAKCVFGKTVFFSREEAEQKLKGEK